MSHLDRLHRPLVRPLGRVIPAMTIALAAIAAIALLSKPLFAETPTPQAAPASDSAKYQLKIPGGLAFSEFRGYEDWAVISIDHTGELMKVILGNPVMIDAFRSGIPGNGKPFPDGAKMAKVEWHPKKSADAPYDINVPGTNYDLDFMVKDAKRFADSGGWGYAVFVRDVATDQYRPGTPAHKPPQGNDAKCGAACHTIVKRKDFVFTDYAKR